jgi:hypothetical protein
MQKTPMSKACALLLAALIPFLPRHVELMHRGRDIPPAIPDRETGPIGACDLRREVADGGDFQV